MGFGFTVEEIERYGYGRRKLTFKDENRGTLDYFLTYSMPLGHLINFSVP